MKFHASERAHLRELPCDWYRFGTYDANLHRGTDQLSWCMIAGRHVTDKVGTHMQELEWDAMPSRLQLASRTGSNIESSKLKALSAG